MAKVKEYDSFAEIAAALHRNDGEAYVQTYTSVNEPVRVEASKSSDLISKVRVTMHVEEDKGVQRGNGGGFYRKDVQVTQERDNEVPKSTQASQPQYVQTPHAPGAQPQAGVSNELTPLAVLKNFVDNIAADVRTHTLLIVLVFVIATAALVVALI